MVAMSTSPPRRWRRAVIVIAVAAMAISGCSDSGGDTAADRGPDPVDSGPGQIDTGPGQVDSAPARADSGGCLVPSSIKRLKGSLVSLVNGIAILKKATNSYVLPTAAERTTFRLALTRVLRCQQLADAASSLAGIGMELLLHTDTGGGESLLVRENSSGALRGRPLVAINPTATRGYVMQAPHAGHESYTRREAATLYLGSGAIALMVTGAHRCSSNSPTTCSGNSSLCTGTLEAYRISDAAHSVTGLFHIAHEVIASERPGSVSISLHGMAKKTTDPNLIISDGTTATAASTTLLRRLAAKLRTARGAADVETCNSSSGWTRLCGTTNVQGRYINGSSAACTVAPSKASGRFLHIEQSLSFRSAFDPLLKALIAVWP